MRTKLNLTKPETGLGDILRHLARKWIRSIIQLPGAACGPCPIRCLTGTNSGPRTTQSMNEGVWQRRIPRQDKAYDWLETTVTYSNLKMQQNGFRYSQRQQVRVEYHRSRIRYLGKKNREF